MVKGNFNFFAPANNNEKVRKRMPSSKINQILERHQFFMINDLSFIFSIKLLQNSLGYKITDRFIDNMIAFREDMVLHPTHYTGVDDLVTVLTNIKSIESPQFIDIVFEKLRHNFSKLEYSDNEKQDSYALYYNLAKNTSYAVPIFLQWLTSEKIETTNLSGGVMNAVNNVVIDFIKTENIITIGNIKSSQTTALNNAQCRQVLLTAQTCHSSRIVSLNLKKN